MAVVDRKEAFPLTCTPATRKPRCRRMPVSRGGRRPQMQTDRDAFAKRLEESERQRIQNHARFGGAKKVHS